LSPFFTDLSFGEGLLIFRAKGQKKEQMEKHKVDCYTWAKQETDFDPMQAQPPAQAPPAQPQGTTCERVTGAGCMGERDIQSNETVLGDVHKIITSCDRIVQS